MIPVRWERPPAPTRIWILRHWIVEATWFWSLRYWQIRRRSSPGRRQWELGPVFVTWTRRVGLGLALSLLLSGCALFPADRLSVERGQFFVAYRQASVAYAGLAARMRQGCQAQTLSAETCQEVTAIDTEMRRLSQEIDRAILKGERSPDWDRIGELLGGLVRLALKVL